ISADLHSLTVNVSQASFFTGSQIIFDLQAATATATLIAAAGHPINKQLVFQGGTGSDTLRVDLPAGASLPATGIELMGNAAATGNCLELDGAGQDETLTANGGAGDQGTISDSSGTISFTNLRAADLHGLGIATFATSAGDAPVELLNGFDATLGGTTPALQVQPNGSGTSFPTVALWDNTQLTIDTTADPRSGAVTVASANNANNHQGLAIRTAGAADTISIPGAVSFSGAVSLSAAGSSIAESGTGCISAGQLTTQSAKGTTLNDGNTVGSFSASNTTSGGVQLNDSATPLTITSVSQAGGNVQIVNYGGISITGTIADTAAAGAVSLMEWNAGIQETGTGMINSDYLISQSKTGTTLNAANAVSNYLAWNDPNGGNIQFTNTRPLNIQLI